MPRGGLGPAIHDRYHGWLAGHRVPLDPHPARRRGGCARILRGPPPQAPQRAEQAPAVQGLLRDHRVACGRARPSAPSAEALADTVLWQETLARELSVATSAPKEPRKRTPQERPSVPTLGKADSSLAGTVEGAGAASGRRCPGMSSGPEQHFAYKSSDNKGEE